MNLILLEASEIRPDGTARVGDARAAHVRRILKSSPGHQLRIGIIDGPLGTATITAVADDAVHLECQLTDGIPPIPPVDLLLALPRPKVMRRLWAQLAALGVGRIVLTNAEKVERDYFDTHILQPGTYRPLLLEGLQQAKDTRLPIVSIHKRFKVLVEDDLDTLCPQRRRFVAHPGENEIGTRFSETSPDLVSERALLAIGPEGGWNPFELALLESRGFSRVGLGPRSLRTDTACVAMLALMTARKAGRRAGTA